MFMKALVIDDSKAMRRIIQTTLKGLGFDVQQAEHGGRGLEMLNATNGGFDLVMVDWNMPEVNGFQFVQRVRENSAFDDIKLIMCTTETEFDQMLKALDAGANEYLMKPFTKEALLDKLGLVGLVETDMKS
jgi:two-component system chemotaxis response regulator CheY